MAELVIIGAGRLGTVLARALAGRGHRIAALTCRRIRSARESQKIIGQGKVFTNNVIAAKQGEMIFLCLPDESLKDVARELSRFAVDWDQKIVFHTSGLLSSEALRSLKNRGAKVASFHPIQSFAKKNTPPSHFQGVYFGLEGDQKALAAARKIVADLGGHPIMISAGTKALYHAASSVASNFLVVILDTASKLLHQAGISRKTASRLLFPLVEGTLQNVKKIDIRPSLTGPVLRGDTATVRAHLRALRRFPKYSRAYRALALLALEAAIKGRLPSKKFRALKSLLEDK